MPETAPSFDQARHLFQKLLSNLQSVIYGNKRALQWLLAAFSCNGHVLLEDVPGTGKTTLAKALAASCTAQFQRIQFTPDLLPSDIIGITIFDRQQQVFRFEQGPLFCNILLADEINRASPRTQSALLEAMAEAQVSIDRENRALPTPFFVIATQNPIEFHGTYPLPEAQLDRFSMRFGLGYVSAEEELNILTSQGLLQPVQSMQPCIRFDELKVLRQKVAEVRISTELQLYIIAIVTATRQNPEIQLGASPRASLTLMKCAQALSLQDGYDFVTPDVIQELAVPVIAHRISLHTNSKFSGITAENTVQEIVNNVPVPV